MEAPGVFFVFSRKFTEKWWNFGRLILIWIRGSKELNKVVQNELFSAVFLMRVTSEDLFRLIVPNLPKKRLKHSNKHIFERNSKGVQQGCSKSRSWALFEQPLKLYFPKYSILSKSPKATQRKSLKVELLTLNVFPGVVELFETPLNSFPLIFWLSWIAFVEFWIQKVESQMSASQEFRTSFGKHLWTPISFLDTFEHLFLK